MHCAMPVEIVHAERRLQEQSGASKEVWRKRKGRGGGWKEWGTGCNERKEGYRPSHCWEWYPIMYMGSPEDAMQII